MDCPKLLRTLVVGDDPKLLAQVSCLLAKKGCYLPVVDGPRMTRHDFLNEVVRCGNAAATLNADQVLFAGLSQEICDLFSKQIPISRSRRVTNAEEVEAVNRQTRSVKPGPVAWGTDRVGYGLLTALREQRSMTFGPDASPSDFIPSRSGHWVVCEDGYELGQVIAANYAFSLDAGLILIPEVDRREAEALLESFYSLYEAEESVSEVLERLRRRLRDLTGELPIGPMGSITFISQRLPFGAGFPEFPTTHLAIYPQLGVTILNGFAAEQGEKPGIGCAVLVDPQKTEAPEMEIAARLLSDRRVFIRGYVGPRANVRDVSRMIEFFPYDLLVIATHCGDASGWRWTYEFEDSSGKSRRLEVDTAIGVAISDRGDDKLHVTQIYNFISLDWVLWHDPDRDSKVTVGTALLDWEKQVGKLEPVSKVTIPRVFGAAVFQMDDNNYLPMPGTLAGHGHPIILSNACASWHRLSETYCLSGARAYIGTLYPITALDAESVTRSLLGKQFGKNLPVALWSAQRDAYGRDSPRRPYTMAGVFTQRLRTLSRDVPTDIAKALLRSSAELKRFLKEGYSVSDEKKGDIEHNIKYLEREAKAIYERWVAPSEGESPKPRTQRRR